ncbi:MAG: hypothetical protein K5896_01080 [Prevotella sp.]|nr:hypothetical protein [Prevotella sp.]
MSFISTPITYEEGSLILHRDLPHRLAMLDNLVELIVFTPRGSFDGDPDFGFEYWNHEYSNVNQREFNASQGVRGGFGMGMLQNDITKKECEDSIRDSLATYEPMLKNVTVNIVMEAAYEKGAHRKKIPSKYELNVVVDGMLDDGVGTRRPYRKIVTFYVEPVVKKAYR